MNRKIAWILAALYLGLPILSEATVFWNEDFENHLSISPAFTTPWDVLGCPNASLASTIDGCNPGPNGRPGIYDIGAARAHSGTHVLRHHYGGPASTDQGGTYINRTHPATSNLWVRWYHRTNPGWVTGTAAGSKIGISKGNGHFELVWHMFQNTNEFAIANYPGVTEFCPSTGLTDPSCNWRTNMAHININDGNWHCLEGHADIGTGSHGGTFENFVDGTQVLGYYNVTVVGTPGASFNLITQYDQFGLGDRDTDDLAVGNTRIGCAGSPPSDQTAPAQPRGLKLL